MFPRTAVTKTVFTQKSVNIEKLSRRNLASDRQPEKDRLLHREQAMRILVLSDYFQDYYENKASFRIRYLTALRMSEKGHNVVFMFPSQGLKCQKLFINNHLLKIGTPGLLPKRLRSGGFGLLDILCKSIGVLNGKYDVIHVTNGHRPSQFIPCLLGKYLKRTLIVDECWEWLGKGGYADKRKGVIGRIVAFYDARFEIVFKRVFDHIVVIATALKNRFDKTDLVTVLHGGAENNSLKRYEISEARQKLGIEQNAFCIGISNLMANDHEDNKIFFSAFCQLCKKYGDLFLIATGSDDTYINEIGQTYHFTDRLISPGYVDFDTYNVYLGSCDVFVLPLTNTNINKGRWPNKIGDYVCIGRPIITNPTGDIKELFEKYKVGLLCEATPDAFYELLDKVINKKLDISCCTDDCEYVATNVLSFDKRVNDLLAILKRTIEARRPRTP